MDGDKKILNIKKIFEQISLKFENYIKEGNVSNQNYDDILNSIKTVDHNKDSIVGNVLQNSYYLYFSENENLDDIISEEENKLVKKIYFFDKEKAQGESVAREFGLKPITEITKSIKKVKVENHDYYLEHILVNDKPLNYKNLPEFTILCTQNDAITYKNKNSKKAQSFTGNLLQVLKPQPTYPHKSSNENNSKTPVLNYVMIGLLGLLLGGIGGYFGGEFFKKEEKAETVTEPTTYPDATSAAFQFKIDKDSKGYVLELNYQNKGGEQKLNGARVIPISEYKSKEELSKREQLAKKGFKLSDIDRKLNINSINAEISKNIIKTQNYGRGI